MEDTEGPILIIHAEIQRAAYITRNLNLPEGNYAKYSGLDKCYLPTPTPIPTRCDTASLASFSIVSLTLFVFTACYLQWPGNACRPM